MCLFLIQVVDNLILRAAIMIFWLVAIPGFLIISSVSEIANIMSLVVPAIASLFGVIWEPL